MSSSSDGWNLKPGGNWKLGEALKLGSISIEAEKCSWRLGEYKRSHDNIKQNSWKCKAMFVEEALYICALSCRYRHYVR